MAHYCCDAGGTSFMEQTTEWVSGEGRLSAVNKAWFCHHCGSIWQSMEEEWPRTELTRWNLWFRSKQRRQPAIPKKQTKDATRQIKPIQDFHQTQTQ